MPLQTAYMAPHHFITQRFFADAQNDIIYYTIKKGEENPHLFITIKFYIFVKYSDTAQSERVCRNCVIV